MESPSAAADTALIQGGANPFGEFGVGYSEGAVPLFETLSQPGRTITAVGVGARHSALVSCEGGPGAEPKGTAAYAAGERTELYWFGLTGSTRLDPVKKMPRLQPTRLPVPSELRPRPTARCVGCGVDFTLFTTDAGGFFGLGANSSGQLGLGHEEQGRGVENAPQPNAALSSGRDPVTRIVCGAQHAVVERGASGEILSFGSNRFGQLGLGFEYGRRRCVSTPTRLRLLLEQPTAPPPFVAPTPAAAPAEQEEEEEEKKNEEEKQAGDEAVADGERAEGKEGEQPGSAAAEAKAGAKAGGDEKGEDEKGEDAEPPEPPGVPIGVLSLRHAACGELHTVLCGLLDEGRTHPNGARLPPRWRTLVFGGNTVGQLGLTPMPQPAARCEPRPVRELDDFVVRSVACGAAHTVVVTGGMALGDHREEEAEAEAEAEDAAAAAATAGEADMFGRTAPSEDDEDEDGEGGAGVGGGARKLRQQHLAERRRKHEAAIGAVYSFGRNDCGQLGHGHLKRGDVARQVMGWPELPETIASAEFETLWACQGGEERLWTVVPFTEQSEFVAGAGMDEAAYNPVTARLDVTLHNKTSMALTPVDAGTFGQEAHAEEGSGTAWRGMQVRVGVDELRVHPNASSTLFDAAHMPLTRVVFRECLDPGGKVALYTDSAGQTEAERRVALAAAWEEVAEEARRVAAEEEPEAAEGEAAEEEEKEETPGWKKKWTGSGQAYGSADGGSGLLPGTEEVAEAEAPEGKGEDLSGEDGAEGGAGAESGADAKAESKDGAEEGGTFLTDGGGGEAGQEEKPAEAKQAAPPSPQQPKPTQAEINAGLAVDTRTPEERAAEEAAAALAQLRADLAAERKALQPPTRLEAQQILNQWYQPEHRAEFGGPCYKLVDATWDIVPDVTHKDPLVAARGRRELKRRGEQVQKLLRTGVKVLPEALQTKVRRPLPLLPPPPPPPPPPPRCC